MDEACKRLIDVLKMLRKNTMPVPWLSNPESVEDGWKVAQELLIAISQEMQDRYGQR